MGCGVLCASDDDDDVMTVVCVRVCGVLCAGDDDVITIVGV